MIAKQASLLQSDRIWQDAAQRMKCKVSPAIKSDKGKLTADVSNLIVSKWSKGEVKDVIRHLKGWYRNAAEMQARPCHQTMEHQTDERVELYGERAAYSKAFLANGTPFAIGDN
jgi:hypothetical protein